MLFALFYFIAYALVCEVVSPAFPAVWNIGQRDTR